MKECLQSIEPADNSTTEQREMNLGLQAKLHRIDAELRGDAPPASPRGGLKAMRPHLVTSAASPRGRARPDSPRVQGSRRALAAVPAYRNAGLDPMYPLSPRALHHIESWRDGSKAEEQMLLGHLRTAQPGLGPPPQWKMSRFMNARKARFY